MHSDPIAAYKMKEPSSQRRKIARKGCQLDVSFVIVGRCYSGYVTDIGSHGAFIEAYPPPAIGDEISLSINYKDLRQPCKINGYVVRLAARGFGVAFRRNNPDI